MELDGSVMEAVKVVAEQIKIDRLAHRLSVVGITGAEPHLVSKFQIELIDPYWYFLKMREEKPGIKYYSQPLHGDLHTDNIQIDSDGVTHLIDWNYDVGHSSLDYAFLETSVWAHCASHDFLIQDLDQVLTDLPFPGDAAPAENNVGTLDSKPLMRCKAVVRRIRTHATGALHEPKAFHYAIGLFVCAVQQLQYEDANLRAMLVLSHHAIAKLEEEWGYVVH